MAETTAPHRTEIPDEERRALITIETMDRLAAKVEDRLQYVIDALAEGRTPAPDIYEATALLRAIREEAQIRMATAVKDQALSDDIASAAIATLRRYH